MTLAERYGRWAVILGASEGTGAEFARQAAAQGMSCVLIARREGPLTALAAEIGGDFGIECVTACIDLAALDAPAQVAAAIGAREVGLMIFNAGSDPNGALFLERELSDWIDLVQRNVMTMMQCVYAVLGPMKARRRGGIILVNSGACYGGSSGLGPYCGSKAFTLCLAEALWGELRPHGVDVLTLVMGQTDTPEFRRLLREMGLPFPEGTADPAEVARVGLERLPHGPIHNWGQADDEAGMASGSAAQRRQRVIAIDAVTNKLFGRDPAPVT